MDYKNVCTCIRVGAACVYVCTCVCSMHVCMRVWLCVCVFMEREMESFELCIIAFSLNIVGLMFKENTEYP